MDINARADQVPESIKFQLHFSGSDVTLIVVLGNFRLQAADPTLRLHCCNGIHASWVVCCKYRWHADRLLHCSRTGRKIFS